MKGVTTKEFFPSVEIRLAVNLNLSTFFPPESGNLSMDI
jgi:hypothetical protein